MIRLQRTVYINNEPYTIWLSMKISKNKGKSAITIYYHTDDPHNSGSRMEHIKGGFKTKEEAVSYAVRYVKKLYIQMINR